jgi:hypothetical protein
MHVKIRKGEKVILHFGAVDWQATVNVNGKEVGSHTGGYTAFSFDITDALKQGENELVVKVYDPTDQGIGPHGKQVLSPANIYYTASSGIWQTVWMETVPADYIENLTMTPDIDKGLLHLTIDASSARAAQSKVSVKVPECNACKILNRVQDGTKINLTLQVPNARLWSPDDPYLYDLEVTLGKDKIKSYFGMRKISIGKDDKGFDRIMLNNNYTYNLGTLDQGFWPDGLYTAPTDEALEFDIKAIKAMGFNTIRKHIKVEPARWYYYADKLGMMVWQDLVNPNQSLPEGAKQEFEKESAEIVKQLHNYPCITTWVLFNEKWGQYDQERLTKWLKAADPSRLVNGHSGEYLYVNGQLRSPSPNAYVGADMTDVHSYPNPRMPEKQAGKAMVCGEFGGIGVPVPGHEWNDLTGWGYVQVTANELDSKYDGMVKQLRELEKQGLSGSIYTQPFDVEGEENGLITYDREIIKIPINRLREIHSQLIDLRKNTFGLHSFIAKSIDKGDNDGRYVEFQTEFGKGRRDSVFLRRLTLIAIRKKDLKNSNVYGISYLQSLKKFWTRENLKILTGIIKSADDKGFESILNNVERVDSLMGRRFAENFIIPLITEKFWVQIGNAEKPELRDAVQNLIKKKYGILGLEAVWTSFASQSYDKSDVSEFVRYKDSLQINLSSSISAVDANNDAWFVFERSLNKAELKCAISWTINALKGDPNNYMYLDTYANLLYKLGKFQDAIAIEERVVTLSNRAREFVGTLEKMKAAKPTWGVPADGQGKP